MRRRMMASIGGGAKLPTARDYVQDGLVAMWDGIENDGWGVHDGSATKWKELISGTDCKAVGTPTWGDKFFRSTSNKNSAYFNSFCPDLINTPGHTVEIVSEKRTDLRGIIWGSFGIINANQCNFEYYIRNSYFRSYYNADPDIRSNFFTFPVGVTKYFAACREGDEYTIKDSEGRKLASINSNSRNFKQSVMRIGADSRTDWMCFDGDIFCIRVYNRALTAEEITANYAIDKARFDLA